MNITVFGVGLVGSAIVRDLAPEYKIDAIDLSQSALNLLSEIENVNTIQANVREEGKIAALVQNADLVISAVPGFMGFETLKRIIEAGKNVVDIAFFPEDPFLLDDLAKEKGVTVIVDCGVAPGFCNVMAGYLDTKLDSLSRYLCYVGGLPVEREFPYEYKAVFSPADVIEEYVRPARYVEYGKQVVKEALTDIEKIDFPGVGTLEAFNTDGLRSIMKSFDMPFMKEKTLRFPGHAELMRGYRESGFFSLDPIEVDGQSVIPLNVISKLMFDKWKLQKDQTEFTVMQVEIDGEKKGKKEEHVYYLLDYYDKETNVTSMARTTGYTCTIIARQVLKGMFNQVGICPPEYIGRTEGCMENLLEEYEKRGIKVTHTIS
jgi:lysine 6-dehydrogenase